MLFGETFSGFTNSVTMKINNENTIILNYKCFSQWISLSINVYAIAYSKCFMNDFKRKNKCSLHDATDIHYEDISKENILNKFASGFPIKGISPARINIHENNYLFMDDL